MALSDDEFNALMEQSAPKAQPLVNENQVDPASGVPGWMSKPTQKGDVFDSLFSPSEGMQPNKPSVLGDLLRGIDNLEQTGGGLAALLGNATGMQGLEDWGMGVYKSNEMEARQNPAAVGTYKNIHGIGDALRYGVEAVAENLPMFVPSLVTGGIGGVFARSTAETYVKNLVADIGEEGAAKLIAKRVMLGKTKDEVINLATEGGSLAGAYVSSAGQEMGSIYGDTVDQTGVKEPGFATLTGAAAGLLDALPEGALLQNVLGRPTAEKLAKGFVRRLGEEGAKQFLREAPTELVQTIIEQSAISHADPSKDLFSEENWQQYIDAGLKGGIGGVGMGVGGELAGHLLRPHPDANVRGHQQDIENQASEITPAPEIPEQDTTPEEKAHAKLSEDIATLETQLADPNITDENKVAIHSAIADAKVNQAALETQMQTGEQPVLVNENKPSESPAPGTLDAKLKAEQSTFAPGDIQTTGQSVEEIQAAAVKSQRAALLEEQSFLQGVTPEQVGMDTNTHTARLKEIAAQLQPGAVSTLENKPSYNFVPANLPPGLEKEHVDAARETAHAAIETLVNEKADPEQGAQYKGTMKAAVEGNLNFLAGQNIAVKKAPEGKMFRVVPRANGNIEIQIPSFDSWKKNNDKAAKNGRFVVPMSMFNKLMEHEVIHAAWFSKLREDWQSRGSRGAFDAYVESRSRQIGSWLQTSYRGLAKDLLAVYDPTKMLRLYDESSKEEGLSRDGIVGGEFIRMLVERARTGLLTEDVAAQAQAAKTSGLATKALNAMLRAIQQVRAVIARYLNPDTSTPTIQKALAQTNEVLDTYGIVKPEATPPISEVTARIDETPEPVAAKTLTPLTNPEGSSLPQPGQAELAARRAESERALEQQRLNREALVNETSGVSKSRAGYLSKLESARAAIDTNAPDAMQVVHQAAVAHAQNRLKWNNKLTTADNRARAKSEFQTALQRPVTQAQYNRAIDEAKTERGVANAAPQETSPEATIAQELGITHDGDFMGMREQFTDTDEASPAYGATFLTGMNPSKEEVEKALNVKRDEFSAGERGALEAMPSDPATRELDRLAMDKLTEIFTPSALVNETGQLRTSKTEKFSQLDPQDFEYRSKPIAVGTFEAMEFIHQKGGVLGAANEILQDRQLANSGLDGDARTMAQRLVIRGLKMMQTITEETEINPEGIQQLDRTKQAVDGAFRETMAMVGRQVSANKGDQLFMDGEQAKQDLIGAIKERFHHYFGNKGDVWLNNLTTRMNDIRKLAVQGIVTRSEFVGFLGKFLKDINTLEWRRSQRQQIAKGEKASFLANKGVAMAGQMGYGDLSSEPALKLAMSRILSDMTLGIPRQENAEQTRTVLSAAISEVTRDIARESGLIPESPAKTKVTELQKLHAILTNPELYNSFTANLEEQMIDKFGAGADNMNFRRAMHDFVSGMENRRWEGGLIDSVLNEQMRAGKMSMQKAISEIYKGGDPKIEQVTEGIKTALQDMGISDPEIARAVSEEIDARMEGLIDKAREVWVGKPGSIKKGLRDIGLSMAQYAGTGFNNQDVIAKQLTQHFIDRLGLSDTAAHPHARTLAAIVGRELTKMAQKESTATLERLLKQAPGTIQTLVNENSRAKEDVMDKLVRMANMGILTNANAYGVLAPKLHLPPYNEADAQHAQDLGKAIADMPDGRQKTIAIAGLRNFIESKKGVSWKDMMVAGMYASMLSGPSTMLVNAVSNAVNLLSEVYTLSVQHPQRIPQIVSSVFRLFDSGRIEFRETLEHGITAGKLNSKVDGGNPLEFQNPEFLADQDSLFPAWMQKGTARGLFNALSLTRAKYVTRFLAATDMMFYKAAQEASFAAKTGWSGYGERFNAFKAEVRQSMEAAGKDTTSRQAQKQIELAALEKIDASRATDPELEQAWQESHGDALRITFNQEPQGMIGEGGKLISTWTAKYPLGKVIIPFTRVVANVLNTQVDWSPFGLYRYAFSKDFKIEDSDGALKRDPRILIRSLSGMAFLGVMGMMAAVGGDEDDPYFTIYGSGPTNADKKRQLYDRGWKPNTIKIGNSYVSYLTSPTALALSALGTIIDRHREKPGMDMGDILPQAALAFVQGTLHQSFLSGAADLISSFDSADPEARMERILSRTATLWVPNLFKQVDQWIDPSVQQSDSFTQMILSQIPVVREMGSKPMMNVFGEPVQRVQGPLGIPFSNRFWTTEKTTDPVLSFLSEKNLSVPGYSKQSRLGDVQMTPEQFYQYVQKTGPRVKEAIRTAIPDLRGMPKEQAQDTIDELAQGIKKEVRSDMAQ